MSQWHGGKGSAPRKGANNKAYLENWESIFGKNKPKQDAIEKTEGNDDEKNESKDSK